MASSASKTLLKNPPSREEMRKTIWELKTKGDQTLVLVGTAYLDSALKELLEAKFITLTKDERNMIFGASRGGFLAPFFPKLLLCRAMGLLGALSFHDLSLINDIRIVFAHSLHDIDFQNDRVQADCASLKVYAESCRICEGPQNITEASGIFAHTVAVIYAALVFEIDATRNKKSTSPLDTWLRDLPFIMS